MVMLYMLCNAMLF